MTEEYGRWGATYRLCPKCGDERASARMKVTTGAATVIITTQYECSCCKNHWCVVDEYAASPN